jgi:5'-nucleotidase (lipoprotein e(P4) family)
MKSKSILLALTGALLTAGSASAQEASADDATNSVLWLQTSVEAQGSALGAYALARIRLDEALADTTRTAALEQHGDYASLPPAIILDVDDTVLNTTPYQAKSIGKAGDFDQAEWTKFVESKSDKPVPGAIAFTQYAASKGVKIFYVTNRIKEEEAATSSHLQELGFPMGGNVDTLLTRHEQPDWSSAKGNRRAFIAKDYRILMLVGDNYGDFSDSYKGTIAERQKSFEEQQAHWGNDWIVIANPVYGSFETAAYGNDYKVPATDRHRLKVEALSPWASN